MWVLIEDVLMVTVLDLVPHCGSSCFSSAFSLCLVFPTSSTVVVGVSSPLVGPRLCHSLSLLTFRDFFGATVGQDVQWLRGCQFKVLCQSKLVCHWAGNLAHDASDCWSEALLGADWQPRFLWMNNGLKIKRFERHKKSSIRSLMCSLLGNTYHTVIRMKEKLKFNGFRF